MASKAAGAKGDQPVAKTAPNQTLYCQNLPDKLQKADLRRSLYMLFSTYGSVLEVVALKTPRMRGQAHVVFTNAQSCTQALRALQGFEFYGKDMRLAYAKGKSNVISKLDGTFQLTTAETTGQATTTGVQKTVFDGPPPLQASNGATKEPADEGDAGEAPMDEDDEGEALMEESDED